MNAASSNRRRVIAAVSLILGPALLLLADVLSSRRLTYLTLMSLAAIFLILAALGVAHLLRAKADWFGLLGAGCSLIGLVAYYGMMTLYRYQELIQRGIEAYRPRLCSLRSRVSRDYSHLRSCPLCFGR